MKALHNLSIRNKFAIIIIPLIIVIIGFDYFQVKHKYTNYKQSLRLNKAITIGIEINHVVHEIQKERSITVGYLANNGAEFADELHTQREHTDSTLNEFNKEIINPEFADVVDFHDRDIDHVKEFFGKLLSIRRQVNELKISSDDAIEIFSEVNEVALNTVNMLINETPDKQAAQQVHAIIYFLKAKERASIERAFGTQAYSAGLDSVSLSGFSKLVASEDSYLDAFLVIANEESVDFYKETVKEEDLEEVARLRELILGNDLNVDPSYWYEIKTAKINQYKDVEDYMAQAIQDYTAAVAQSSKNDFFTFIILDIVIGLIALLVMFVIVTNLLKNMRTLEDYTKKYILGEFTEKVQIDTKDEVGHYARTFNEMLDEINKSHAALQKQKDHAEYLYENVIKQSEVVFENVEQGIFLLDKEFKISNLYSKAMETIFDNKRIAGEMFSNFMRPYIIPRDLEALEMFMRHLFNPDMDEDVVNQLNPIEQVKIYTETSEGINTKYIRVAFSRIEREGVIQNIMVTISDETQAVLLKRHMEEAESIKQQETELMLSILKIDPSVLRGFLYNSRKVLRSISERYEKHDNQYHEFTELIEFTFQSVHNIKGNAVLIGVTLITEKLHKIEESIDKLRHKDKVEGNDFLTILYEIDGVDKIIADMQELLLKVADVYRKFPSQGHVVSNVIVMDTLERGLNRMSKEVGKDVSLHFENEQNIVIPEYYTNPFKDILVQLMRNTLSHGIETPNDRVKLGKPIKGNINVELSHNAADEMVIDYKDDGKGLDIEGIRKKAILKGLITEGQAEKMRDADIMDLIFNPGFSTNDKADEYAGRGQGMSLVKTIIESKDGSFEINSETGKFFQMTIKLPLANRETEEIA